MAMAAGVGRDDPPAQAFSLAAEAFGLLASPLRLHIVLALTERESGVSQLALRVGATPQAVSQHLAKLKLAGVVRVRSEGRCHVYEATDPRLATVAQMMLEGATAEAVGSATRLPA
ncbi:ArsR/SmtB family transcription factor [Streptomyces sp. NPDC054933]